MGFRLLNHAGMIPAWIENCTLYVEEDLVKPMPLPALFNTIKVQRQCNYVSNSTIRCYLKNETYEIVIWNDGSIGVYTRDTRYRVKVLKAGSINLGVLNALSASWEFGGLFSEYKDQGNNGSSQAYLLKSLKTGKYWLFSRGFATVVKGIHENQFYIYYRRSTLVHTSPFMYLEADKILCNAYGKIFELEFEELFNPRAQYKLGGVL